MPHDFCSIPLPRDGERYEGNPDAGRCACGYRPPYELIAAAARAQEVWPDELEGRPGR